jgi:hypothetical protein
MGNTRDTGYLQNLVTYDASGNIVLPANLTVNGNLLVATQSYVTTQINNLINGAPALLDTLDELAAALGDDASFASTITTSIAGKQTQLNGTGFVKVTGTTVSYDNSTYLTTASASSTYQTIISNPVTGTGEVDTIPKFTATGTIGNSTIRDLTEAVAIGKRVTVDNGASQSINITPGLGGVVNEISTAGTLPLRFITSGSSITFAAGGTTPQITLASSGEVTLTGNLNLSYSYPRINLTDTDHNSDYSIINADGSFTIYDSTAGANRLFITSGGDVGIGTAPGSPSKKLEISDNNNSTSTITGLKIINYSLTANARSGIVFQSYDNNGAAIWSNRTGTTTGELLFGTNNSAGTAETNIAERMRIYSDGVVTTEVIQLNNPTYFASNYYGIRLVGVDNGVNGTNFQIQGRTIATGGFSTLFTVTNTGAATFSSSVSVGAGMSIGTTGTNNINWFTSGGIRLSRTNVGAEDTLTQRWTGSLAYVEIAASSQWNGGVTILPNGGGNVLIGTTTPNGNKLQVNGGASFSNAISPNGGVFALGDVLTTTGRLLVSNGSQGANTETASILLGNRGYFTTSDIGAARISAVAMGANWYSGTGLAFYTNPGPDVTSTGAVERMRIASAGVVQITNLAGTGSRRVITDSSGNLSAPQTDTAYNISLSGMSAGSWFTITDHNFNGFSGLVVVTIPNLNSEYGYISQSSAWIFQQGANLDPSYDGLRGVTIRPDGTSYEGYNVVESYHTAPNSGRVNMRMRLRQRNIGLGASNPLNLQILVDHVVGITAGTPTLTVRSF